MIEDPTGRARLAIIGVIVWLVIDAGSNLGGALALSSVGAFAAGQWASPATADNVATIAAVVLLVAMIAAFILSARWILLVSRNAHLMSDQMSTSPGWAVGWYFIPFASLWKPFQAMQEIWRASVNPNDPGSVPTPGIMGFWWGLWIINNLLGSITPSSVNGATADSLTAAAWFGIASLACDVPLAWLFITLIRQLSDIQLRGTQYAETFA
jgi:hypothetical protein